MAKEEVKIFVAFCEEGWKPFPNERECLIFIEKEEHSHHRYWSYTIGKLDFYTPYFKKDLAEN